MRVREWVSSLDQIMEPDHVIQVHADGSVSNAPDSIQAPELHDGELDLPFVDGVKVEWTLVGHSTQQGGGQIMHNSEFIGGGLADEILMTPGYYVALVCHWSHDENVCEINDCEDSHDEGWAVAYREARP